MAIHWSLRQGHPIPCPCPVSRAPPSRSPSASPRSRSPHRSPTRRAISPLSRRSRQQRHRRPCRLPLPIRGTTRSRGSTEAATCHPISTGNSASSTTACATRFARTACRRARYRFVSASMPARSTRPISNAAMRTFLSTCCFASPSTSPMAPPSPLSSDWAPRSAATPMPKRQPPRPSTSSTCPMHRRSRSTRRSSFFRE
jgi:hypothetical protein